MVADDPTIPTDRRRFLSMVSSSGLAGVAGCVDLLDDPDREPADESSPTEQSPTDGDTDDRVSIEGEPNLEVVTSSIDSDHPSIGSDVSIETIIEHVGDEYEEFVIEIELADVSERVTVGLEPAEQEEIRITARPMTVGETAVELNGTQLETIEVVPVAGDDDRTIGAYYFSWYGTDPHTWRDGQWSLESPYTPTLGDYDATDPAVIEQHIDWCHFGGVTWLNAIWTGAGSPLDENLKEHVFAHPRATELEWSIFYDTLIIHGLSADDVSEVDMSDDAVAAVVRENIEHIADEYIPLEHYKTIDGRPVLTTWLGHLYTGTPQQVFSDIFQEVGIDPYFIVGIDHQSPQDAPLTSIADAVTMYNPYVPRFVADGQLFDELESTYQRWEWHTYSRSIIPTVIPGFDDSEITHVERDNPVLEPSPDRFAKGCDLAMEYAEGPILVTAFNEWYESTFIEPSEEFGLAFLEITAEKLLADE